MQVGPGRPCRSGQEGRGGHEGQGGHESQEGHEGQEGIKVEKCLPGGGMRLWLPKLQAEDQEAKS